MPGRSRTSPPRRVEPPGQLLSLLIFGVAALARIAVAASLWNLPLVRTPKLDSAEYLAWAQRIASGDWTWPSIAQHGPGYPVFLAGLLVIGSGSLVTVMVLQSLVGACTAVLVALVARRLAGARAGLFAGLTYAVYGPAVYLDTALLSEGLLLFLLALALWALSVSPLTSRAAMLAGAAFGAAALVRPTALVIAVACLAWTMWTRRPKRVAVAMAVACVAVLAPALMKSWSTSRTLSIQGYGGLNAYIGNSPLHEGRATFRLGGGWDALNAEAPRAGIADPAAQDRYYVAKTWREIADHPGLYAKLVAAKALWLLQAEELRDSHSYYFFTQQSPLLRVLPRWALLFPLACVGAFVLALGRLKPSDRVRSLLLIYAIAAAAGIVFLVVGFRYRMPLVPVLAIAAGVGVDAIAAAFAGRQTRQIAIGAAVAAGAVVVSHLVRDPRHRNLAEEWALTGSSLVTERRLPDAEAAYRRALALDPQSGLAWDGLGLVLYNSGRLTDARSAYERALAIDRDNSRAIYHKALVDAREGRLGPAVDGYQRALALSPFDAEITRDLAGARRQLATELGMSGRTREARDTMRRVLELTPDNGEVWLDVCLLSLDLHDKEGAAAAFARARALGADPARLAFADQALARMR